MGGSVHMQGAQLLKPLIKGFNIFLRIFLEPSDSLAASSFISLHGYGLSPSFPPLSAGYNEYDDSDEFKLLFN